MSNQRIKTIPEIYLLIKIGIGQCVSIFTMKTILYVQYYWMIWYKKLEFGRNKHVNLYNENKSCVFYTLSEMDISLYHWIMVLHPSMFGIAPLFIKHDRYNKFNKMF